MASTPPASRQIPRRAVAAGLSWAAPAIALAAAAPAMAASPGANDYRFLASINSEIHRSGTAQCWNDYFREWGGQITKITLSNQVLNDPYPLGFSVVEVAKIGTTTKSDRTTATLKYPVQFVAAYPEGMVDLSQETNGFSFTNSTQANWSGPTARKVLMTNPDGYELTYDVFTFTWLGKHTQSTVADYSFTGATRSASWAGTALTGTFSVNNGGYCVVPQNSHWYFAGYYLGGAPSTLGTKMGTYTTANGRSGGPVAFNGNNWVNFRQYIRQA